MSKYNRVLEINKNGEYLTVEFERNDGEIAAGEYKLIGWADPPWQERIKFENIINDPQLQIRRRKEPNQ